MSQKIGRTGIAFAKLWHHVDLAKEERTLGRLASAIAVTLIGKHKPVYHPTIDCGDYVVVTNCAKLRTTGNKLQDKQYWRHSSKPGQLKLFPMERLAADKGFGEILRKAVSGMLPKNKLRKVRLERLKVFEDSENPYRQNFVAHWDQQPEVQNILQKQQQQQSKKSDK